MADKTYSYLDLKYEVSDDDKVSISVNIISDGYVGTTTIIASNKTQKLINDSGTAFIGYGKGLKESKMCVVSNISNLIDEEDEIIVQYEINGDIIKEHKNLKSESEEVSIILIIKFP